ncbi:hypothetical protein BTW15_02720 [Pseudomonas syringae pv. tomato]|uniref:Phage-related protein n=2 Tax=Pseudomonas syringae group genomosp. 3 TaxID=251701 RepID=A0AB36L2D0_PSEUB|nr:MULTISPECIES: hypothetical protein [Pseudomonas]KPB75938.1 Uncharacterized protein AC505_4310 [Pseudomonas syringae pv. maculicola]KPW50444.1 Phage-related protein [Pseudomonas syringae pv. antirrhini]KTB99873.1 hypothetical protein AO386_06325 [Pseudomonas syringae ICMP 11292]MBI6847392.1 hypothetical protein [Pseudomonas syringae]MBX6509437.1 hypothetical protein [Pseudomonas syringae pv. tomato]
MTQAKERPILFSAPMVRAILSGQKTVTRRVVKPQYCEGPWSVKPALESRHSGHSHDWWLPTGSQPYAALPKCPYGKASDRLWVRETWSDVNLQGAPGIAYRADADVRDLMEDASFLDEDGAFNYDDPRSKPYQFACWSEDLLGGKEGRWRPSIHIPRWASRILLEITDVRVERLQDICEEQALAEGVMNCKQDIDPDGNDYSPQELFAGLWTMINGDGSWRSNPWVWVVEFKRVTP